MIKNLGRVGLLYKGIFNWLYLGILPSANIKVWCDLHITSFTYVQGLRPELPKNAHSKILDLMQRCWDALPCNRPSFTEIRIELEEFLQGVNVCSTYILMQTLISRIISMMHCVANFAGYWGYTKWLLRVLIHGIHRHILILTSELPFSFVFCSWYEYRDEFSLFTWHWEKEMYIYCYIW